MQTYVEHILKTTSMNVEMEKKYQHQIYGSQTFSIRSDCLAFFCVCLCVCVFILFSFFLLLIVFQKLINTIRSDPVAVNICNAAVTLWPNCYRNLLKINENWWLLFYLRSVATNFEYEIIVTPDCLLCLLWIHCVHETACVYACGTIEWMVYNLSM